MQSVFSSHNGIVRKQHQKEIWKIPKYLEIKQYTSEYPVSQEEIKMDLKIFGAEKKWKCDISKLYSADTGKCIALHMSKKKKGLKLII